MKKLIFIFLLIIAGGCQKNIKKKSWVFILAGQSNMAGRANIEASDSINDKSLKTINAEGKLIQLNPNYNIILTENHGLDPGISFAKKLRENINDSINIIIIQTAIGGTSVENWLNDDEKNSIKIFSNFKKRLNQAKEKGEIKAILWQQGEANALIKKSIKDYDNKLKKLFTKFREITANETLPILVAEVGRFSNSNYNFSEINHQIRQAINNDKYSYLISSEKIDHLGDSLHFNTNGERILGERFCKKFLEILDSHENMLN